MIHEGVTRAGKVGLFSGQHDIDDRFRVALYGPDADLSRDTLQYTTTGEIAGDGYVAGGIDVVNWRVEEDPDGAVSLTFDPTIWRNVTLEARGALVYNDSVPGLPTVAVIDFGRTVRSTEGRFIVSAPTFGMVVWL